MPTKEINRSLLKELSAQVLESGEKLSLDVDGHIVSFTNLDKPMFFTTGESMNKPLTKPLRKRDYLHYLLQVSEYVLPHLHDRPVTQIRFPNGMYGMRFFQKHSEQKLPAFVETVRYFSESTGKDSDYFLCNNLATFLWFAQMAVLEFHTMHSRIDPAPDAEDISTKFAGSAANVKSSLLNYPDFLVLDLDPYLYSGKENKGEEPELHKAGFQKACEVALVLRKNLEDVGLNSFVKTSGKTGLHIFVPIIRNVEYDVVRSLAQIMGVHLQKSLPNDVTMEWKVANRPGKIFFDHNMNGRGKTLASIYSPRATAEANISAPVTWAELESGKIYPTEFTMKTMPARLLEVGDLWLNILHEKKDLQVVLQSEVASGAIKEPAKKTTKKTKSETVSKSKKSKTST
jgi:bifunctional non-homologous end joining protein LigD